MEGYPKPKKTLASKFYNERDKVTHFQKNGFRSISQISTKKIIQNYSFFQGPLLLLAQVLGPELQRSDLCSTGGALEAIRARLAKPARVSGNEKKTCIIS